MTIRRPTSEDLILASALLALASLALMGWSVVSRGPLAVIAAMSVGQVLMFVSLVLYGWAIIRDVKKADRKGAPPPGS